MSDPRATAGPSEDLGPLLVRLRTERGLAQKQVARSAEINGSTLSRLESGERGVSREILERIGVVLNLDRQDRLNLLVAAGFLTDDAGRLLADESLARFARVLSDPATLPGDIVVLRGFLELALAHARALGYDCD
ncbi:MAG: helix-turn-helix transcriptional regulator [Chloroflexia bacterium]|nr:helix-turn-helix transcriptional regulator [Chloroflexia bacterium]